MEQNSPAVVAPVEPSVRPTPERAAFEAWFSEDGKWPAAVLRSGEGYTLAAAQSAWVAWCACGSAMQRDHAGREAEVLAVLRYCADVQSEGTVNERIVARTVARMLARPPEA